MSRFGVHSKFHVGAVALMKAYGLQEFGGEIKEGVWTRTLHRPGGATWDEAQEPHGKWREDWVEIEGGFEIVEALLKHLRIPILISTETLSASYEEPSVAGKFVPGTVMRRTWDGSPLPDYHIWIKDD